MPVPLDELPIHQVPLSFAHVGSSDRNFYDRSYFNAHGRTGDLFLITGFGVYPNLGVRDAFATVRTGDVQHTIRFSDAIDAEDRAALAVGGFRIEVVEPLHRLRLICEADDPGPSFDLSWEGSFPAVQEQPHLWRTGPRAILDACRFAQVGSWEGTLRIDGADIAVSPDTWLGTRDRSWGIRPVGEAEPAGRGPDEDFGFWWLYTPFRFEDFAVVIIAQEDATGFRSLNDASRVFADGRVEQLGWPRVEVHYRSGTRQPEGATLHCTRPDGTPLTMEIEALGHVGLNVGAGYGGDPDWNHGRWMGPGWSSAQTYDLTDPAVAGRVWFSVVDHVGRATCDGQEGWGLFEHGTIGRHDPSGFTDLGSVAP